MKIETKIMLLTLIFSLAIFVSLSDSLVVRKFKGCGATIAAPGYSNCYRCKMPWKFCENHLTLYGPKIDYGSNGNILAAQGQYGCFPLCKKCWQELQTPVNRLLYYRQLWVEWQASGNTEPEVWEQIKASVMAGN